VPRQRRVNALRVPGTKETYHESLADCRGGSSSLGGGIAGGFKSRDEAAPTTRPAPKTLSEQTLKGLQWLAKQQLEKRCLGPGRGIDADGRRESTQGRAQRRRHLHGGAGVHALGSSPKEGPYKDNINRGVAYICGQAEEADEKSLYVTGLRQTRTQQKLGGYIDTFMAAQVLGELRQQDGGRCHNKRVTKALDKVVGKIELNQKDDGKCSNDGWAPTLSQARPPRRSTRS